MKKHVFPLAVTRTGAASCSSFWPAVFFFVEGEDVRCLYPVMKVAMVKPDNNRQLKEIPPLVNLPSEKFLV